MPPLAVTLLFSLAEKAPGLIADIIAELHKSGKITTQEVIDFLGAFPKEGGISFFPSLQKLQQAKANP